MTPYDEILRRLQAENPGQVGEAIEKVLQELQAYRDAAQYNVYMSGPVFRSWNRSALDRARWITERSRRQI